VLYQLMGATRKPQEEGPKWELLDWPFCIAGSLVDSRREWRPWAYLPDVLQEKVGLSDDMDEDLGLKSLNLAVSFLAPF